MSLNGRANPCMCAHCYPVDVISLRFPSPIKNTVIDFTGIIEYHTDIILMPYILSHSPLVFVLADLS